MEGFELRESENPLVTIRNAKGLSQNFVAVKCQVQQYLVMRTEQACFPNPPPSILKFYVNRLGCDETELLTAYHAYQRYVRRTNGRKVLGDVPTIAELSPAVHPFKFWAQRNKRSTSNIAKSLCIAQPVLSHFENKPRQQQTVPKQFLDALKDAGYTDGDLELLQAAYERHRAYLRIKALEANPNDGPLNEQRPA